MIAPHNTGKSTTALRLLRAGYHFLADGMALIRPDEAGLTVGGYPLGEVKLRDDVLALFPAYRGRPVRVREQRKTVVDLRGVHPEQVVDSLLRPERIQLCFMGRGESTRTEVTGLSRAEALARLPANTVYWAEPAQLQPNSVALQALLDRAELYRLQIGSDEADLLATVDGLGVRA
jgi:hypothetical protein